MLKSLPLLCLHGCVCAGLSLSSAPAAAASPAAAVTAIELSPVAFAAQARLSDQAGPAMPMPVNSSSPANPPRPLTSPADPGGLAHPGVPAGPVVPAPNPQHALAAPASTLSNARGGTETVSTQAQLSGVVSSNSATQVTTGANIIQSNSFANASGIPVVIQNSGANVLIQNATVINLQLK